MTKQNKPSKRKSYKLAKWQIVTLKFLLAVITPMLLSPTIIHLNIYITILS